jgi:dihydroorotase
MSSTLIVNANIVNEGKAFMGDVFIRAGRIERIGSGFQPQGKFHVLDAKGKLLLPGAIDDQVHFREPGLTHKAEIESESRAAVAGGVTSFMEMPNTVPPVFTQALLAEKYQRAALTSAANYSFFMGTSNDNYEEVMRTNLNQVCGLKIFMGSSTGNLLVDDPVILNRIFGSFEGLIAVHCEHEPTVRENNLRFRESHGNKATAALHPIIRNVDACYLSSSFAVGLAEKHGTRLHILHISTGKETGLFRNDIPLSEKKITAEACIHHLWFSDEDYERLGNLIKWNPAIKSAADRKQIWDALLDDRIDIVATDHAPHTMEEKSKPYFEAPAGGPLVQHGLTAMLEFWHKGKISLEQIVQKMSHNPAILFRIEERGFIREGYWADLVLVDPNAPWLVAKDNILAKCGWSPFMGQRFHSSVTETFVSGNLVFENGNLRVEQPGARLTFKRI